MRVLFQVHGLFPAATARITSFSSQEMLFASIMHLVEQDAVKAL